MFELKAALSSKYEVESRILCMWFNLELKYDPPSCSHMTELQFTCYELLYVCVCVYVCFGERGTLSPF